jgi:hypothetical protein
MTHTTKPISPLRQRMIEDMTLRKLSLQTQASYIRAVVNFTRLTVPEAERSCSWPILPASLEAGHRLLHQLRPCTEIPKRIADADMTEVGGQDR